MDDAHLSDYASAMARKMLTELRRTVLPNPSCVLKVGDGRGFVIEHRAKLIRPPDLPRKIKLRPFVERRLIVTAGHCFLPKVPPAFAFEDIPSRTYRNLLGRLDSEKKQVCAECLFVDPIADIAVLGPPDCQELYAEATAYDELVENLPVLRIGNARNGPGWMLTLDCHWVRIRLDLRSGMFGACLTIDPTEAGQSGSPILDDRGHAVRVVAIGAEPTDTEGRHRNERCGPQPILRANLPGWFLQNP